MKTNGKNHKNPLHKSDTLKLRLQHLGSPTSLYFKEDPIKIVKGEGQYLFDENGKRYLDCINNVAHVGHCHPHVTEVACKQMAELYTNSRFLHDNLSLYAERLTSYFPKPLNVCFFTNSGSEANDLALTLAKCYTKGNDVITMESAYHGHVRSCLDVCSPSSYCGKHCESKNPVLHYAEEVEECVKNIESKGRKISAFILESIQSCGGQIILPPGYMRETFKYVHDAGGVCIVDEVQSGFGRVGKHFWAFQLQGDDVIPDIVTIGKPMGNGHPVSAVITTAEIADSLTAAMSRYFNTFGGNPVSMAISQAVLDVIEDENLQENALKIGEYLLERLSLLQEKHDIVGDVRGVGLFCGLELVKNRKTKVPATLEAKLLHRRMKEKYILVSTDGPHDNVIKLKPPMCFNRDNVDQLVKGLDEALSDIATTDP